MQKKNIKINDNNLPIALFDSGMGGLTVFKALSDRLPNEDLIYLGDTARLPYGTKGRDTIIRYTLLSAKKLLENGAKMLVIACNTATATALPTLQQEFAPLPVLGVVEPGAKAAANATKNGEIVVIATEATIASGVYQKAICQYNPEFHVQGKACTLFVPLAEEGFMSGDIVEGIASHYISKIFDSCLTAPRPDTLLLGCTHFPPLENALRKVVGNNVTIVNPANTVAESVEEKLTILGLLNKKSRKAKYRFLTTDNCNRFVRTGKFFLGTSLKISDIELVDL